MKKILVLGAGFTANFGAPVAKQVWNELFNSQLIQQRKDIRSALLKYVNNHDFESFYDEIMSGEFLEGDKKATTQAIEIIFQNIDEICKIKIFPKINTFALLNLIQLFSNHRLGKGFIFTLNQDLFLERLFKHNEHQLFNMPLSYLGLIEQTFIENDQLTILPTLEELESWKSTFSFNDNLYYIKLHGSYKWKSCNGTNQLIIGKRKNEQIKNEPLLNWYFELFQHTLSEKAIILIMGYSFSDEHINNEIIKSIKEYGSSLIICDIVDFNTFKNNLLPNNKEDRNLIIENLRGYYINLLEKALPGGQITGPLQKMLITGRNAHPYLRIFLDSLEVPANYFETNPFY